MPDLPNTPVTAPSQAFDADKLLATILSAFGKVPKEKRKPAKADRRLPANAKPLSFDQSFNMEKTGYINWVAKARVVLLQEQTCETCGSHIVCVKDELFLLTNAVSHSAWLRHEGYGIEQQEDLPIQFQSIDDRVVTCCSHCARSAVDSIITQLQHEQVQLHFPF